MVGRAPAGKNGGDEVAGNGNEAKKKKEKKEKKMERRKLDESMDELLSSECEGEGVIREKMG